MRIGIDVQALQTVNSRNRGIGRYTQSVIENLIAHHPNHTYQLFANRTLPDPEYTVEFPYPDYPFQCLDYPQIGSCNTNDLLLKTTVMTSNVDAIFVPSPMEGLDATLPNYKNFGKPVFTICYDLIPLLFKEQYLSDPNMNQMYWERLENIRNADFIFAISEATRQDTIHHLGIAPDKILNVLGGVSPFFAPIDRADHPKWQSHFAKKFGIQKPFILYTGGEDWRKNIEGLVKGYAKLPKDLRDQYQLVVACKVSEPFTLSVTGLAKSLGIGSSLVLTNYISDDELKALYSTCSLFVFPSFYEGFGLPLLEAMACGAPSIASRESSLPEILGNPDQLFDPASIEDMARVMQSMLTDASYCQTAAAEGYERSKQFTWEAVAQKMADAFSAFRSEEHLAKAGERTRLSVHFNRIAIGQKTPKAAFFSPFRPEKSGIADYSHELIPNLSEHFNLELFHDDVYVPIDSLDQPIYPASQFETRLQEKNFEALIYQIGNSSFHFYMYSLMMRYPGISVLHDYGLSGLCHALEKARPELGIAFATELEHNYGKQKAKEILASFHRQEIEIEKDFSRLGIYVNRRIFTRSLGVILHSQWAYKQAIQTYADDNECIAHIPLVTVPAPVSNLSRADLHAQLGIPRDRFVIATLGFVHETKRAIPILQAFRQYLNHNPSAYLIYAGGMEYSQLDLTREIEKLGLQQHVQVTGFISMAAFNHYIEAADICLNLRFPSNGESSASLTRTLGAGRATIVTDIGSFGDYPDDVVLKLPTPDQGNEVDEIVQALIRLGDNADYRKALGDRAAEYITTEHSPERCSRLYAEFIEQVLRSPQAKQKMLTDHVGRELATQTLTDRAEVLSCFAKVLNSKSS